MLEDLIIKLFKNITKRINDPSSGLLEFLTRRNPFYGRHGFIVSVTTRCNFNCPHCLRGEIDKNKSIVKDLPLFVFEEALKGGRKLNFHFVSFTGGEPILHPQFEELVSLAVKYGYKFNLATNGWFYKEYWELIKNHRERIETIFLSLDGATAKIHDAVRDKPGSFNKVIEAVEFYKSRDLAPIVTFCVTRKNFHQIEEFVDFCATAGINKIKWATVNPVYGESGIIMNNKDTLTDDERADVLQRIFSVKEKFGSNFMFLITRSFFPIDDKTKGNKRVYLWCPVLNCNALYLDHDGGMFFCCDINRECQNKPLIQHLGFEKSFMITLDVANKMKKRMLKEALDYKKITQFCDFCNKNIKECINLAAEESNNQ